jgi:hypothetical protein
VKRRSTKQKSQELRGSKNRFVRKNSWRVFLQRRDEKRELRRGENSQGKTQLPEFRFDGRKIIFNGWNGERVKSEKLEKREKNWWRNDWKRNVKVETEKGQSDAGQAMICLCGGPEG